MIVALLVTLIIIKKTILLEYYLNIGIDLQHSKNQTQYYFTEVYGRL